MKSFSLVVTAIAAFASSAAQAVITYSGSVIGTNSATASYTITTDGTLGTLSASNFVSYTLSINGLNSSGTGTVSDGQGAASATATALSFNFSLGGAQQLIFFDGQSYLCFTNARTNCLGAQSPAIAFGSFRNGVKAFALRSGVEVIATSGVVPEPASWAMLITGFGLTGAAMRRRKAIVLA